ncbi:MAG TPA: YceI family protein [Thermoleophilia bacterium]
MSQSVAAGAASRTWNGIQFPSAGTWVLDPTHTTVEFEARHLMVAKVKGRFGEFEGALHIADDPTQSSVDVTIKAASIDTRTQQRDDHLRSPDFLEVDKYPELTFTSNGVEHGDDDWRINGDLTIHGVTKPVTLKMEYNGQTGDPWGGQRAFFSAETKIDREAWGLTWNAALETGGWVVGKELKISIEIESVLQTD